MLRNNNELYKLSLKLSFITEDLVHIVANFLFKQFKENWNKRANYHPSEISEKTEVKIEISTGNSD